MIASFGTTIARTRGSIPCPVNRSTQSRTHLRHPVSSPVISFLQKCTVSTNVLPSTTTQTYLTQSLSLLLQQNTSALQPKQSIFNLTSHLQQQKATFSTAANANPTANDPLSGTGNSSRTNDNQQEHTRPADNTFEAERRKKSKQLLGPPQFPGVSDTI